MALQLNRTAQGLSVANRVWRELNGKNPGSRKLADAILLINICSTVKLIADGLFLMESVQSVVAFVSEKI